VREIVVATYNVRRCIGADRRHDPDRVAAVLAELDADIVALQELSTRTSGEGAVDQVAHLAAACGLEAVPGPIIQHARGSFGNALLTRFSPASVDHLDLSVPGCEPRAALDVTLETPTLAPLRVVATHLGLSVRERRRQVPRLVAYLERVADSPLVVLGDMNEWRPGRTELSRLDALMGRTRRRRTFPATRPLLALDRIWVRPAAALEELGVHRSQRARIASDHLPVRGVLRLPSLADAEGLPGISPSPGPRTR
jgi:endonuclease/exonuclease/phosphatase family metal-dependent hydrolase